MALRSVAAALAALVFCDGVYAQAPPHTLRASVALASDYVQNGLLQTNNEPSLRLAIDYEHDNGLYAGGTLTNVDYVFESRLQQPRDSQTTVYTGYLWTRGQWRTNLTLSHYLYPDFERDYDYTQTSLGASYRDRYFVTLAYSSDYLDLYDRAKQVSAGLALPWIQDLEFSLSAGRLSFGGQFASSFSYWDVGLSRPFGRFALDLRYHDNSFDRNSIAGNLTEDQWVVSMTYSLLPLPRLRDRR